MPGNPARGACFMCCLRDDLGSVENRDARGRKCFEHHCCKGSQSPARVYDSLVSVKLERSRDIGIVMFHVPTRREVCSRLGVFEICFD